MFLINGQDAIFFSKAFLLVLSKKYASLNFWEKFCLPLLRRTLFLGGVGVNLIPWRKLLIWYLDNVVIGLLHIFGCLNICISSSPWSLLFNEFFVLLLWTLWFCIFFYLICRFYFLYVFLLFVLLFLFVSLTTIMLSYVIIPII